jgi:hypothetical protein
MQFAGDHEQQWDDAFERIREGSYQALLIQHDFSDYPRGGTELPHRIIRLKEQSSRPPKVFVTLHSVLQVPSRSKAHRMMYRIIYDISSAADRIVVLSSRAVLALERTYGISAKTVEFIPSGVLDIPLDLSTRTFKSKVNLPT